jgi:hypothetical protein
MKECELDHRNDPIIQAMEVLLTMVIPEYRKTFILFPRQKNEFDGMSLMDC